ncbi:MAG: hypothetical protein HUU20_01565 [Pirellulales bacterium]|nr:hypothetical protein [Pirellulales bacterium]
MNRTAHAASIPRQFGIGTLLVIMAMYGVLFGIMRALSFPPVGFALTSLFFTVTGVAQLLLYKGKQPIRASVVAGACFGSGLSLVHWIVFGSPLSNMRFPCPVDPVEGAFAGAILGFVCGVLISGAFLVLEKLRNITRP